MNTMKTLILGGGWVGARICQWKASGASVITSRSKQKLEQLKSLGLEAVEFDLARQDTWDNLPSRELISAIIITFPISATQLPSWKKLLADHVPEGKLILCLGTSSAFQCGDHLSVVNEKSPLTGVGVTGQSLQDRTEGENWMLTRGAVILHLTGIVGEEKEQASYGEPRSVRSFFQKGYARNGLRLINLIHVADIVKIITLFLTENSYAGVIKGERIIASGGAFRWRDLVKGLGAEPLPEILPPDPSMQGSKIASVAKLCSMLPAGYVWTQPVEGVKPVSMGLPASAARDRQWELLRQYSSGKWQGTSMCYDKVDGLDHGAFWASFNAEGFPTPSFVIPDVEHHIYFLDADSAVRQCKGFKFDPKGEKRLKLSRQDFNLEGNHFVFQGVSCRSSVDLTGTNFFAEVSFYFERSLSMIVAEYSRDPATCKFSLTSICVTPLQCADRANSPPSQSNMQRSVSSLLNGLQDKSYQMQWMSCSCDETGGSETQTTPTKSMLLLASSNSSRLVQSFDADLVCSLPIELVAGQSFDLVFGCGQTDSLFQSLTVIYNCEGRLERQTFERWD